jgi:DNA mismatch repair protein MutL
MPIRLLSPQTVNRIAAGEVIERPAAAVKELVENALDAGAKRIRIAIEGGGVARVEVTDDGCGIAGGELALAIERHATSKLADEALIRIATLGFRGEALPSIGAAAKLTLTSRPPGADSAWRIVVAGGAVSPIAPVAAPCGTSAVVEDLFYATPARRKFLRSAAAEAEAVTAIIRHLALAAPDAGMSLAIDGRMMFDLPRQAKAMRTGAIFGRDTDMALTEIDAERDGVRLTGFASPAALHRAAPRHQAFIVNGRPVRDPLLRVALRLAYRDVIPEGRHPIAALWLSVPPEALDVNVHPAKTELRFADPNGIRSLIIGALRRALAVPVGVTVSAPGFSFPASTAFPMPGIVARGFAEREAALPFSALPAARSFTPETTAPDEFLNEFPLGAPLAQVFGTYVLAVAGDGSLVIVDQHAAHERLTEEKLRAEWAKGGIAAQPLLNPVPIDLPEEDVARLADAAPALLRLGLELEAFGPGAILVRAMPAALGTVAPAPLIRDLADTLAETGYSTALVAKLDAILARMACHRSIRAGRQLEQAEMAALLREMEATPRAATCSHGRPTFLKLSREALEGLFGRRG